MTGADRNLGPTGWIRETKSRFAHPSGARFARPNSLREFVEPVTSAFGGQHSIQLSYGRFGTDSAIVADDGGGPKPRPDRMDSRNEVSFRSPLRGALRASKLALRVCRTCDLCLRRAALYPAELRAHGKHGADAGSLADVGGGGNAARPRRCPAGDSTHATRPLVHHPDSAIMRAFPGAAACPEFVTNLLAPQVFKGPV